MPLGPPQQYLAQYNGHQLPGYVQSESFDSQMNIAAHYGAYVDGSISEETGLGNKDMTLTLKVWEQDYLTTKQQVELAATMLRSTRAGFAPLYVQYTDRHYSALVRNIQVQKEVGTSVRTLDYQIGFECRPWIIEDTVRTLTGTGIIDTDQVDRTIVDGGWTPTIVTLTGTNVTISGYTDTIAFTGYISVSGLATGMVVDSEAFTAMIGDTNKNNLMDRSIDYRLYVGPEKTYFAITGASSVSIEYYNRWYL